jgi:hypothetical protein
MACYNMHHWLHQVAEPFAQQGSIKFKMTDLDWFFCKITRTHVFGLF